MPQDSLEPTYRPASIDAAIDGINIEIYRELRRAVETGRWADGSRLTTGQRAHSLQAVIAWEARNLPPESRTGYIEDRCKSADPVPPAPAAKRIASDREPRS